MRPTKMKKRRRIEILILRRFHRPSQKLKPQHNTQNTQDKYALLITLKIKEKTDGQKEFIKIFYWLDLLSTHSALHVTVQNNDYRIRLSISSFPASLRLCLACCLQHSLCITSSCINQKRFILTTLLLISWCLRIFFSKLSWRIKCIKPRKLYLWLLHRSALLLLYSTAKLYKETWNTLSVAFLVDEW